jgi:hypothetical protein
VKQTTDRVVVVVVVVARRRNHCARAPAPSGRDDDMDDLWRGATKTQRWRAAAGGALVVWAAVLVADMFYLRSRPEFKEKFPQAASGEGIGLFGASSSSSPVSAEERGGEEEEPEWRRARRERGGGLGLGLGGGGSSSSGGGGTSGRAAG